MGCIPLLGEHVNLRALESLAARLAVPVTSTPRGDRPREHIAATAYHIVSEGVDERRKQADAGRAHVTVRRDGDVLRCEISDDGRGERIDPAEPASCAFATAPKPPTGRYR